MSRTPSPVFLATITACVVAAGVGAGIVFQPTRADPADAARGPRATIALITPPEPELEPGSRMDVGALVDGYEHRGAATPPVAKVVRPAEPAMTPPPAVVVRRPAERPSRGSPPRAPVVVERAQARRWPSEAPPRYAEAPDPRHEARLENRRRRQEARRERPVYRDERPYGRDDDRYSEPYPEPERRGPERRRNRANQNPEYLEPYY